jgi:hypothetical protein
VAVFDGPYNKRLHLPAPRERLVIQPPAKRWPVWIRVFG